MIPVFAGTEVTVLDGLSSTAVGTANPPMMKLNTTNKNQKLGASLEQLDVFGAAVFDVLAEVVGVAEVVFS